MLGRGSQGLLGGLPEAWVISTVTATLAGVLVGVSDVGLTVQVAFN
jgi:hypothetical protein